jgi:hypothetical protein
MERAIINNILDLGFRVFMRDQGDGYLYFTDTDAQQIGALSIDRLEGICLTTVHKPNTSTGTGFSVARGAVLPLTRSELEAAFRLGPSWPTDLKSVAKWRDWQQFTERDSWNAGFVEVHRG